MRVVSQTALIFFEKFKSFFPIPPVLLNRREEEQMKNIIKWFVLLMHKDMQNFEMNEDTCKFCSNGTPILKSAVHSF